MRIDGINPDIPQPHSLHERFERAKPFRHVCIDKFLDHAYAQELVGELPAFDPSRARNEFGEIGGKATEENLRSLGSAFTRLDDLLQSDPFLKFISDLSGVSEPIFDPSYFGGGIHENLHGQELDPHIDFNRDPKTGNYRRLNLIIYLSSEWEPSWGGALEFHTDPFNWQGNQITSITPQFNRCVLFEALESSWNGFPRITLPIEKRHLSLRYLAVNFYSKEPADSIEIPAHSTFYAQRPLPKEISAGRNLSANDIAEITTLLQRRDSWIKHYQNKEIEFGRDRAHFTKVIGELERKIGPTLLGYIRQLSKPMGWHSDGWCGARTEFFLQADRPVKSIRMKAFLPAGALAGNTIRIFINGRAVGEASLKAGEISTVEVPVSMEQGESIEIKLEAAKQFVPAEVGQGTDPRSLSYLIEEILAEHP